MKYQALRLPASPNSPLGRSIQFSSDWRRPGGLKATGKPKTHTNSADRAVGSTESRVSARERHKQPSEMLLLHSRSSHGADCEYWAICFEHPWSCVVRHFGQRDRSVESFNHSRSHQARSWAAARETPP